MEELFLDQELALAMKQKGFDEPCVAFFNTDGKFFIGMTATVDDVAPNKNSEIPEDWGIFTTPTWDQARRWFDDKFNIIITIKLRDCFDIYSGYVIDITQMQYENGKCCSSTSGSGDDDYYVTYGWALQDALKRIK